jgi:predicted ATP-binding protein involved in virulence
MTSERLFVKGLNLENFRCFERVELGPFDPHFNLLVGKNGIGKSSILLALANSLRKFGEPESRDFLNGLVLQRDIRVEHWVGTQGVTTLQMCLPSRITTEFFLGNKSFITSDGFENANESKTETYGYYEGRRSKIVDKSVPWSELYDHFYAGPIALIAFYKTIRNFRDNPLGNALPPPPPAFRLAGLNYWDNAGTGAVGLREWIKDQTFIAIQRKLRQIQGKIVESSDGFFRQLLLVQGAIVEAVEDAKSIEYDADRSDIVIQSNDGSRRDFAGMSDGQRALIGLVADIARRACLLNAAVLGAVTLRETPGLVLIDELDLHLHPRWQRRVVADLKRIFPKIQFFATTHSPQVIGEARPEEIVLLTPQGQKRPSQTFGMDSNWVLESVMEADGRDPEVRRKIAAMFAAIEDERFDDARRLMRELRETIGEAPDVVAAESYLWNLEQSSFARRRSLASCGNGD